MSIMPIAAGVSAFIILTSKCYNDVRVFYHLHFSLSDNMCHLLCEKEEQKEKVSHATETSSSTRKIPVVVN